MVFKNIFVVALWMKVASELEGLKKIMGQAGSPLNADPWVDDRF